MTIIFGIDDNFAMQCGVTITSICINNPNEDISFHILTAGLQKNNIEALKQQVNVFKKEIFFHVIDEKKLEQCYIRKNAANGKIATYFRFLIPNILKEETKAIYFDSDLIIRKNLKEFWNTDLSGYAIGVCPGENNDGIHNFNRLKYDKTKGYFNAGVLIMNLEYWRNNKVFDRLIEYASKMGSILEQQDQDVLNYVLQDEKLNLPITYNIQEAMLWTKDKLWIDWHYFSELDEALKDPAIIHYTSALKPWYKECYHPFKHEWWLYLERSIFGNNYKALHINYLMNFKRLLRMHLSKFGLCRKPVDNFRKDLFI